MAQDNGKGDLRLRSVDTRLEARPAFNEPQSDRYVAAAGRWDILCRHLDARSWPGRRLSVPSTPIIVIRIILFRLECVFLHYRRLSRYSGLLRRPRSRRDAPA